MQKQRACILLLLSLVLGGCGTKRTEQSLRATEQYQLKREQQQLQNHDAQNVTTMEETIVVEDLSLPNPVDSLLPPIRRRTLHRKSHSFAQQRQTAHQESLDSLSQQTKKEETELRREQDWSLGFDSILRIGVWGFVIGVIVMVVVILRYYRR